MPPRLKVAGAPEATRLAEGRRISARPISVVLADDHPGVRRSLRAVLDGESDLEVLAEAGDFEETARLLGLHRPHVLVVDLWSSDGAGPATIGDLHARARDTRIVVVTMNDSPAGARALLGEGAAGFVLKELADSDLPQAVRVAADGGEYVSPRIAGRLRAQSGGRTAVGGERGQSGAGSGPRDTGSRSGGGQRDSGGHQGDRNNT